MTTKILNEGQMKSWKEDGYIVITDFFLEEDVEKMKIWADEIAKWPHREGEHLNYNEIVDGKKILGRIENFLPFHKDFRGNWERAFFGDRLRNFPGRFQHVCRSLALRT